MSKEIKKLDEKLWKLFSEYVRRRDAYKFSKGNIVKCVTCSCTKTWKEMDAGHFISRSKLAIKFDEKNVNCQCKSCNGPYGSGKQYEHALAIDRMHGPGTAELLLIKSKTTVKWGKFEYELLIQEVKAKLSMIPSFD